MLNGLESKICIRIMSQMTLVSFHGNEHTSLIPVVAIDTDTTEVLQGSVHSLHHYHGLYLSSTDLTEREPGCDVGIANIASMPQ